MHAPHRTRLPATRSSMTRKATVCGFEVYVILGFFDNEEDGGMRPGEVFVKLSKHGTELAGLMDAAATFISIGLQYGVPWEVFASKLEHTRFGTPDDKYTSLCDGLAKIVTSMIDDRKKLWGEETETTDASEE